MKNRSLVAFAAIASCVFSVAQAEAPVDTGPSRPVHVTNDESSPVPVTGTLEIGGTPSVSITNTDPVPVAEQENPDRFPYAEIASVSIDPPFVNNFITFPTPPGRRYIIEHASMTCVTPSSSDVFTQALLTATKIVGPSATQSLASPVIVLEKRGPAFLGGELWSGTANVKVIAEASPFNPDGSGGLVFNIFHTESSVTATCTATLFGHTAPM